MSVVDPGGGDVVSGGVIEVSTGTGTGGAAPDIVTVSGLSKILYNGKTLELTRPPHQVRIDPYLQRTVNVTLTGVAETILRPRVDVRVTIAFRPSNSQNERIGVDNCWQWAQHGNVFRVILDSTKTVSTTLTGTASVGTMTIPVANPDGITVGNLYAIISGPNYQLVRVDSVSGDNITVVDGLDYAFPSGAIFRDWLLWDAIIPEAQSSPIADMYETQASKNFFNWSLEFAEAVTD